MKYMLHSAAITLLGAVAAACGPIQTRNTVVIEQPKPLEVNVNLSGRLELVITDARQDLETINGAAPTQQVSPADIGLPADAVTPPDTTAPAPTTGPAALLPMAPDRPVSLLADIFPTPIHAPVFAADSESSLIESMKARHQSVNQLWKSKLVGESHTGLLVPKAALAAAQSAIVSAENKDRQQLYAERTAKNETTEAAAALAYYLQRLGYAQKGEWVEKYDKQSKTWEWKQWGE